MTKKDIRKLSTPSLYHMHLTFLCQWYERCLEVAFARMSRIHQTLQWTRCLDSIKSIHMNDTFMQYVTWLYLVIVFELFIFLYSNSVVARSDGSLLCRAVCLLGSRSLSLREKKGIVARVSYNSTLQYLVISSPLGVFVSCWIEPFQCCKRNKRKEKERESPAASHIVPHGTCWQLS